MADSAMNQLLNERGELVIHYDPLQYDLYRAERSELIAAARATERHPSVATQPGTLGTAKYSHTNSKSVFAQWPLYAGRGRLGEFPVVVAREHFRRMGYFVLASEYRR